MTQKLYLDMTLENQPVSVEFYWYGNDEDSEPDWNTMEVIALLPSAGTLESKHLVKVTDLLNEDQWHKIEVEIYSREDELRKQALKNEF